MDGSETGKLEATGILNEHTEFKDNFDRLPPEQQEWILNFLQRRLTERELKNHIEEDVPEKSILSNAGINIVATILASLSVIAFILILVIDPLKVSQKILDTSPGFAIVAWISEALIGIYSTFYWRKFHYEVQLLSITFILGGLIDTTTFVVWYLDLAGEIYMPGVFPYYNAIHTLLVFQNIP